MPKSENQHINQYERRGPRKPSLHKAVKKMIRLEERHMEAVDAWSEKHNINTSAAIRGMIELAHEVSQSESQ